MKCNVCKLDFDSQERIENKETFFAAISLCAFGVQKFYRDKDGNNIHADNGRAYDAYLAICPSCGAVMATEVVKPK